MGEFGAESQSACDLKAKPGTRAKPEKEQGWGLGSRYGAR